jgi:hypothetical protein
MSNPITFPHDARSAGKTAKAGVVTVNDLICEDQYSIMTRTTGTDTVSHTSAVYSLDEDTSSLVESSRQTHALGTDGSSTVTMALLRSSGAVKTMDDVMEVAASSTVIRAHDDGGSVAATFTKEGLKWDDVTSSLYLGGDMFRIQYSEGDMENGEYPSLTIQAKNIQTGEYVTKFSVVND